MFFIQIYFPFTVIKKYWLYSPYCTLHLWAYLTPNSLYQLLSYPYIVLPIPLVTTSFFSMSVSLLFFGSYSLVCCIFLDFTYKISYSVFLFLSDLFHLAQCHPRCCKWQNFILFYGWLVLHLLYPFICWWILRLLPCLGNYK